MLHYQFRRSTRTLPPNERTFALVSIRCDVLKHFALPVKVCEHHFHIFTSSSRISIFSNRHGVSTWTTTVLSDHLVLHIPTGASISDDKDSFMEGSPLSPRIPEYVEYMASVEAVMWGIRERPTLD